LKNKFLRGFYFLLAFTFSCEHFQGQLFEEKSLRLVNGLEGRWVAIQDGKETAIIKISKHKSSKAYNIDIESETDRSRIRFNQIDGNYIGEYHDVDDKDRELPACHLFLLRKSADGWQIFVGGSITEAMVKKHHLRAIRNSKIGNTEPSYRLSGEPEENRKAIQALLSDPDFFQREKEQKAMRLVMAKPAESGGVEK
jgi:hypothetical protein